MQSAAETVRSGFGESLRITGKARKRRVVSPLLCPRPLPHSPSFYSHSTPQRRKALLLSPSHRWGD